MNSAYQVFIKLYLFFGFPFFSEWKVEPNLFQAALQYRRRLLERAESLSAESLSAESLTAGLNLCSSTQEREMFTFYKSQPGNWARPFFVILRGKINSFL